MLYCPSCNTEVQIVPDYNPLDDVLAREVKGSIEGATRPIRTDDVRRFHRDAMGQTGNSTRVLSQSEMAEIRARRNAAMRQSRNTSEIDERRQTRSTGVIGDRRRQQATRKKRLAKKRRQRAFIILLILTVFCGILGLIYYQNSYAGQIRKGYNALQTNNDSEAERYFNKAIAKNNKQADGYTGLSKVFLQRNNSDGAEAVFLTAISLQPSNVNLYEAAISYYEEQKQYSKISELLEGCEYDQVLLAVNDYVSEKPQFSLDEGSYPEVQEVALNSNGEAIYYTTDGTEPSTSSQKYTEPILLNEGQTTIKAISVNKKKIPSIAISKKYTIDIPVVDAPAVSPSTGQYDAPSQITINVPEGYQAFYTTDGTEPNAGSTLYTGPVDMPSGQTIFSAILMNQQGKYTQITKRNYVLEIAQ